MLEYQIVNDSIAMANDYFGNANVNQQAETYQLKLRETSLDHQQTICVTIFVCGKLCPRKMPRKLFALYVSACTKTFAESAVT